MLFNIDLQICDKLCGMKKDLRQCSRNTEWRFSNLSSKYINCADDASEGIGPFQVMAKSETDSEERAIELSSKKTGSSDEVQGKKRFMSFLFGNKVPPIPEEQLKYPEPEASFLSKLTFSWITPVLKVSFFVVFSFN